MSDTSISVKNLGKSYLVGHNDAQAERYTALRDVIARNIRNLTRKTRDMLQGRAIIQGDEVEEFWALKDVSFEIMRGDRVGIIGRNGAGKSTLLKVLSRITEPTTGRVKITGRVASLLEVGTGFHPELSGRENIFLNGAILGMSRSEIQRKFDEIVDFAEVERFLDTPVKRYSSGMYVRLAFAVAAHLDSEILVVDEVLAVGDIEFQKKCLGKMDSIANEKGRTVILVSHNMDAISRLCNTVVFLENGQVKFNGARETGVIAYLTNTNEAALARTWIDLTNCRRNIKTEKFRFASLLYQSIENSDLIKSGADLSFSIKIEAIEDKIMPSVAVTLFSESMTKLVNADSANIGKTVHLKKGTNIITINIKNIYLKPGRYPVGLWMSEYNSAEVYEWIESAIEICLTDDNYRLGSNVGGDAPVICEFNITQS